MEAKFSIKVALLYSIITGPLRFSQGFSAKCIGYNIRTQVYGCSYAGKAAGFQY